MCILLHLVETLLINGRLPFRNVDIVDAKRDLIFNFQVGKDNQSLQRLRLAEERNCGNEGFVLGYPKTAVRAFKAGHTIEENELPLEVQTSNYIKFRLFRLSRDNWQEELKTIRGWARVIRHTTPLLYQAILDAPKVEVLA